MAVITSTATGNFADGSTWIGGVAPTTGDTVVVATGHTVTVTADTPVLGSNASAVGHGVHIHATDGTTFGKLIVANGATLNLQGYDRVDNTALLVDRYAVFEAQAASNVTVDCASDWSTGILSKGHFLADGAEFGIPDANVVWSNAASKTLSSAGMLLQDLNLGIAWVSLYNGTTQAPGPVSNAAGTGLGSHSDSSFVILSSTNGPVSGQGKAAYEDIAEAGDYYLDHKNCILYYKNFGPLSISYTFKYATWLGAYLSCEGNTDDSTAIIENSVFNYFGSCLTQAAEYEGYGILLRYKSSYMATRLTRLNNNTFNFCSRPVQFYNISTTTETMFSPTGNSFVGCKFPVGAWAALFVPGYTSNYEIKNSHFDSFCRIAYEARGGINGAIRGSTGRVGAGGIYGGATLPFYVEDNDLEFYGGLDTFPGLDRGGRAEDGYTYYRRNRFAGLNRIVRMTSYMHIEDNYFHKTYHDGVVLQRFAGYISNVVFKNNQTNNCKFDIGGGIAMSSAAEQWLDNVEFENCTMNDGQYTLTFNINQVTAILGTRIKAFNLIGSNSRDGFTRTDKEGNVSAFQMTRFDHCNLYNNENASNVNLGTPIMAGSEYNLDMTRNVSGVALWNPSGDLAMGKDLSLVVSGTAGVDLSMLLSWGAGSAVELVAAQGTATGGTAATKHVTPGTLIDTSQSWVVDAFKTHQGKIVSGTGSGQVFMVRENTGTTIKPLPQNTDGTWTAPSTDSVYVIFKSMVELVDGAHSVLAGLYIPEVPLTAGTYTDTGITFESNALTVDPAYTSATDLTPTNLTLLTAGFGGGYIGALEPQSGDDTAPIITDPTATATGPTTATASVTTDDGNGTLYFLASTNATESAATVKAALSQSVTTAGEQSVSLSALDPETTYYVHFVHINGASLESASVVSTAAFTTDAIAVKGVTITLHAGTTPQANLTNIVALWWDATTPSGAPDYSTTTASTDAFGVLTLDIDAVTALEIGASGFLLLYKLDATDHRDSLVFAGRVAVSDIA